MKLGLIHEVDVGPAISRSEFAALLWLAGDPNNKLEIVSSHLLAAAQGVLAQDKDLVERLKEYSSNVSATRKEFVQAVVQTELSYEFLQNVTLGDPRRVDDSSIQAVVDAILDEGRKEGVDAATARHRDSARRLKEQTHLAEAARDEAENAAAETVAAAESLAKARDAEAAGKVRAMQRAAIELGKRRHVVEILDDIVRSAEKAWSDRYKLARHASLWSFYTIFAIAGGTAIMLSLMLRNMTGAAFTTIIVIAAILFALTEWAKTFRGKFVDWAAECIVGSYLERRKSRLVRQLKLASFDLKIAFSGDTVQITNRAELLAAAQGEETEAGTQVLS